ncbi:hypothetical protein ACFL57_05150 [Candidatus Margulisiibacteriota bacterium]
MRAKIIFIDPRFLKKAQIGFREMFPRAGEVFSARVGDEVTILTRVPKKHLKLSGLKVWFYSNMNGKWAENNRVEMVKLDPNPRDDRYVCKLKPNRIGVIDFKAQWQAPALKKPEWSLPDGEVNGTIIVRQNNCLQITTKEQKETILNAVREAAGDENADTDTYYIEGKINYDRLVRLFEKKDLILKSSLDSFPAFVKDIYLRSFAMDKYLIRPDVDNNYQLSDIQREAVKEASRMLSDFYGAVIDLESIVKWGSCDLGTCAFMDEFFSINKDCHDKKVLVYAIVHEFEHLYEGCNIRSNKTLEEFIHDYLTTVITGNPDKTNFKKRYYHIGVAAVSVLVQELGFEAVYNAFSKFNFTLMEKALGRNSGQILALMLKGFFYDGFDVKNDLTEALTKRSFRIFLANRHDPEYLESFQQHLNGLLPFPEGKIPPVPEPDLKNQIAQVRPEWQRLIKAPAGDLSIQAQREYNEI